jgi:hypothetical protein
VSDGFGLSQASRWAAKGCVSGCFPVTIAHSVEAVLNVAVEVEGPDD